MAHPERFQMAGARQFCRRRDWGGGLLVVARLVDKAGKSEQRADSRRA